jgi:hypothetical protein
MAGLALAFAMAGCETAPVERAERKTSDIAVMPAAPEGKAASASGDDLGRLSAAAEGVGADAQKRYETALRAFFASPRALADIESRYLSLPLEQRAERWKMVYLLGEAATSGANATLARIAVGEMKPAHAVQPSPSQEEDPTDERIESRAAMALGIRAAGGEPEAQTAVLDVLRRATPGVAQSAALELFAAGKLDDTHKSILGARGIKHAFRRFTPEEQRATFTVPTHDHPAPKKTMTPPPALEK